jgi:hypothetical protein
MTVRHKSIRLFDHERSLLVKMYLERLIPIEQYESRSAELASLVDEWNKLTGRADSAGDLLHFMRTQRKNGKWVRFDGVHLPVPASPMFSAEDTEALVSIYTEEVAAMGVGSDVLAYEDDIKQLIAKEFADRRGRVVAADDLVAKLTALRKRGLLPKVAVLPEINNKGMGFEDINEAK